MPTNLVSKNEVVATLLDEWEKQARDEYALKILSDCYKSERSFSYITESEFEEKVFEKLLACKYIIDVTPDELKPQLVSQYKITNEGIEFLFCEKL